MNQLPKAKTRKQPLSPADVEKRIEAWADVTQLSLDLKRAVLRTKYPQASETELNTLVREQLESSYKASKK
jgi:hypothetical protein